MTQTVDREGMRSDYFSISGIAYDRDYDQQGNLIYEMPKVGIGLYGANTLVKHVEYQTAMCPECEEQGEEVAAYVDHIGDDICPECGCVCNGKRREIWPVDDTWRTRGGPEPSPFAAMADAPADAYRDSNLRMQRKSSFSDL